MPSQNMNSLPAPALVIKIRNAFAILVLSVSVARAGQIVPADFRGAKQPQVAVSPQGLIAVAFGRSNSVYFVGSGNDAKSFSEPVLVAAPGRLSLGLRRGPRIAATEKEIAISAISEGTLFCWTSSDGGKSWSRGTSINDANGSAREGLHAMASGNGKIFAAWLDLRSKQTEVWGAISTNGGITWQKNGLIYHSPDGHVCECCHPSVAFGPEGKITAMWRNWLDKSRDLYCATSADEGQNFGPAVKLGSGTWPLEMCPMDGGGLVMDAGGVRSIWRRQGTILAARDSTAETVVSPAGTQPVVAAGKEGLYYLWQDGRILMFSVAGQNGLTKPVILAKKAAYPAIASGSAKDVPMAVWESDSLIFGQKLD